MPSSNSSDEIEELHAKNKSLEERLFRLEKQMERLSRQLSIEMISAMTEEKKAPPLLYQLKIMLKGSKSPIWRRIQVLDSVTLDHMHEILQVAMGWYNCQSHRFLIGDHFYGEPQEDEYGTGQSVIDESLILLKNVVFEENSRFLYLYDFGDEWMHEILVEKIVPFQADSHEYPHCLKGKQSCPPESCGGIKGYKRFQKIINDKSHPEHQEMQLIWTGDSFDPEEFDQEHVNQMLRQLSRNKKSLSEKKGS